MPVTHAHPSTSTLDSSWGPLPTYLPLLVQDSSWVPQLWVSADGKRSKEHQYISVSCGIKIGWFVNGERWQEGEKSGVNLKQQ